MGDPTCIEWKYVKEELTNFGIFTWTFEEPSKSVNFSHLTISIEKYDHKNLLEKTEPLSIHQPSLKPPSQNDTRHNL